MNRSRNGKLYIIPIGTIGWGQYVNSNFDNIDIYITNLENEIELLKNENQLLPEKIKNSIGYNLIKNPLFTKTSIIDPTTPTDWEYYLLNGASGYKSKSNECVVINGSSLKLSIISSNISVQNNPYGDFFVYNKNGDIVDSNFDTNNILLRNNIYIAKQKVYLLPDTNYTLSAYGKVDIINSQINVGVCWQLAIAIKDGLNVKEIYITNPKYNTKFERDFITIRTPSQSSRIEAEVWLINKSININSIGSAFFTAVQLEHSSTATDFDEIVTVTTGNNKKYELYGDLEVNGNLILSQNELVFNQNKTLFKNNIYFGDELSYNDTLLTVNTKKTIFEKGDIQIYSNITIENNTTTNIKSNKINIKSDNLDVKVDIDIFGNLNISDNLNVKFIQSETIETKDFTVKENLLVGSNILDENNLTFSHKIFAPNKFTAGTWIESITWIKDYNNTINNRLLYDVSNSFIPFGSLIIDGDLRIGRGNNKIIADVKECNLLDTTLNVGDGANIYGNTKLFNDNTEILIDNNTTITTKNYYLNSERFNLKSLLDSSIETDNLKIGKDNYNINSSIDVKFEKSKFYGDLLINKNIYTQGIIYAKDIITDGYVLNIHNNFVFDLNTKQVKLGDVILNDVIVNAKNIRFGFDYNQIESNGNVDIFGDLKVYGDIVLGVDGYNNIDINSKTFNINSDIHIGGGYNPNRSYNILDIDHGGISLFKNGNVKINGELIAGNVIQNKHTIISKIEDEDGKIVFEINREVINNNIKYQVNKAYIDNNGVAYFNKVITSKSSNSNLSTYTVTVGDGVESFGDFNGINAIEDAINYLSSRYVNNNGGVIFIKTGIYNINNDINIPNNIKIIGEGIGSTILHMNINIINIGSYSELSYLSLNNAKSININGDNNKLSSLSISGIIDGIFINGERNIISNNWIFESNNGIISYNLKNIISNNILKDVINNLNINGNIINDNSFVLLNGVINNLIL